MLKRIAFLMAAAVAVAGAQTAKISLASTSTIRVEGTSNVHDWHLATSTFTANIEMATPVSPASRVETVTLSIPVTSLKSGRAGLDRNAYKALNAGQHPEIVFRMTSYVVEPKDSAVTARVGGTLTVNGVTRDVVIAATLFGDAVAPRATGTTTFRMTDFGVKPVTALMGTIRTGNQVTIRFDLTGEVAQRIAELPPR